jgi:uncharacterized protein
MKDLMLKSLVIIMIVLTSYSLPAVYDADSSSCFLGSRDLYLLAVAQDYDGRYTGVATKAYVSMMPGNGVIYLSVEPMAQIDMQASLNVGLLIASYVSKINVSNYDFLVRIVSDTPIIGGPSASGFLTAAIASLLLNQSIRNDTVMTGMIMPDGLIGPVGGIPQKLQAAYSIGAKYMLIPAGQRYSTDLNTGKQVDVVAEGERLGIKVVEVASIYDALRSLGIKISEPEKTQPYIDPDINNKILRWAENLNLTYQSIKNIVGGYRINPQIRSVVNYYIATAQNLSERAFRSFSEGDYYSAASDYYSAVIYLDTARWIIEIYVNMTRYNDLYNMITFEFNNTMNSYRSLVDALRREGSIDLSKMIVLNEIAYRVYEAETTLNMIPRPPIQYLTIDDIYNAVYTLWRINSSMTWMDLYNYVKPSEVVIPIDHIKRSSNLLISYVQTLYTYLSSLGVSISGISNINRLINEARMAYMGQDYIGSSALSIYLTALVSSYLHEMFTTNITQTLNSIKEISLKYLGDLKSRGYDISIPSLYIFRGESISNIDPMSSIFYYELAIADTMWLSLFTSSKPVKYTTQPSTSPILNTTSEISIITSSTTETTKTEQILSTTISLSEIILLVMIPAVIILTVIIIRSWKKH